MGSKMTQVSVLIVFLAFTLLFLPCQVFGHHELFPGGSGPGGGPPCPGGCCGGCCSGCCGACCGGGGVCPPGGGGPPIAWPPGGGGPPIAWPPGGGGPPIAWPPGGGGPPPGGDDGGCGLAVAGDPVFIRNGEYRLYVTDVYIPGRVLPVRIKRSYGSRRDYNSRFGFGWDISYNLKVRQLDDPNTIVYLNGEGCRHEYTRAVSDPNIYERLIEPHQYFVYDDANDTFTLVNRSGLEYDFDINGNLSSITDENGNSITFTYDANGLLPLYGPSEFFLEEEFGGPSTGRGLVAMSYKLIKITDDLGREIDLDYDDQGLVSTITDFAGRTWTYDYNSVTNDLVSVTGPNTPEYPSGLTTSYCYDANHNLEYVYDANNDQVVRNYYDSERRIYQQDVGDGSYQFSYDDANGTTTITNREGIVREMVYNDLGQLVSQTIYTADPQSEPNSFTVTYVYDANTSERTRIVLPAGNCLDYTYDDLGNILGMYRKTSPDDPNDANDPNVMATIYTYDPNFDDRVKTVTDALGNVTTFDYNDLTGNLEKITYPTVTTLNGNETPVWSFTYNQYGQIETITAPDGIVTKHEYYTDANDANNYGRLWRLIEDYNETDANAFNITMEFEYDALGRIVEVNNPNGDVTESVYNDIDQLTKAIAPLPFEYVTKFAYDKNGNQSEIEREITGEPNQITSFTHILQDKIKTITDPLGYVTTYSYNKNEEPNSITDAEDNATTCEYNERGLLCKITDANGNVTNLGYNTNGLIAEVNDPNGNVTTFDYDSFDRLIRINYPDDSNEEFSYDKNSNPTSKKTRKGDTIYYEYDALNRMTAKNRPSDPNIYFTHDITGRVVDVNDGRDVVYGGGITELYYDRAGRVSDVNDHEGRWVSYKYEDRGLRTKLIYPDDSNVTYEYDALLRLTKVKYEGSTVAEYAYDELSRRTLLTLGNDANTVYEYDLNNRLTKLTNNIDDTNAITFEYADYDKVGNRLSMKIDDANAHVYTYDDIYQLMFVDYNDGNSTSYTYDALGNRVDVNESGSVTDYNTNHLNQYTKVADVNYTYDKNGNLTNDGSTTYYYDCENRLMATTPPIMLYRYDYAGRRVRMQKVGLGFSTVKYCYDGDQVIAEYDAANNLVRKFVYGPGIDEPICMIDVADGNTVYYYHFDALGSVRAVSDANAALVERYSYDVFGEPTIRDANDQVLTTSDCSNPYMFTGRRYDNESGLYYYRARYYSPEIGRFLQVDPVGYQAGLNLYTYVYNNPVMKTDPFGLSDLEVIECQERCIKAWHGKNLRKKQLCMACCFGLQGEDDLTCDQVEAFIQACINASGGEDIPDTGSPFMCITILGIIILTCILRSRERYWQTNCSSGDAD